ncbi:hypothetical protein GCK72_020823 [Caenorhabditis remanei]|uniref:Uncharacterized protein n=1 Tax=Caenorhabditis remanei TaxID=31234 RepID=A0A6A5GHW4_CAERE|nr:hypothetical protein GCK72_020823 [Caenorhabditis remanei]KAF1754263.1 hypothetical protein GCK72_020823 [Caenorhabditis remanei]
MQNENNDFSKVLIGRMCGFDDWYVSLETEAEDGINNICPYLRCPPLPGYKQLSMRCFFSFLNQKPSENSRRVTRVLLDPNEKNGWLSDGTLCIEYGFCVESMEGLDGIWKFNYHDKLFDCDQKQNMITYENDIPDGNDGLQLYIHKQLLEFHSPSFKNVICTVPLSYGTNLERIIEFFQISQAVRIGDSKELASSHLTFKSPIFFIFVVIALDGNPSDSPPNCRRFRYRLQQGEQRN